MFIFYMEENDLSNGSFPARVWLSNLFLHKANFFAIDNLSSLSVLKLDQTALF